MKYKTLEKIHFALEDAIENAGYALEDAKGRRDQRKAEIKEEHPEFSDKDIEETKEYKNLDSCVKSWRDEIRSLSEALEDFEQEDF